MKPGYQTTEFWVSSVTALLGLMVALGVITPEQQNTVADAVVKIIGALLTLVPVVTYVWGRVATKKAALAVGKSA